MNTSDRQNEAVKLRAEIADAAAKVKTLKGQIRHRESRLRRIAADAFNEASEPLDGMTTDVGDVVLGSAHCEVSPIGICIYDESVTSLPAQREGTEAATDACLFCGARCGVPWPYLRNSRNNR